MKRALPGLLLALTMGFCSDTAAVGPLAVEFRGASAGSREFFGFSAHRSATGDVTGHYFSRSTPGYPSPYVIEGQVTCVRVVGNRASLGGEVTRFFFEDWSDAAEKRGWYTFVQDNHGHPGVPDRISEHTYLTNEPTTNCPDPAVEPLTVDMTDGDVVISVGE
ncbi:MAG: hypothetical protein AABM40_10590 [Chloroflexota bacterium]